jgi:energy-coupling factor transporter ATP-binding protein EcfA2
MSAAIEVRNLSYAYRDGVKVLDGVSFAVEQGECVGLIGANGAGKSTLLLHFNGLLPETIDGPGAISVMGQPITAANLPEIRRRVGLMFQDPNDQLFCPTVYEDVAFGPQQLGLADAQIAERVTRCLMQVGLGGFEKRLANQLSVGERRRACLAGVLACEPRVLGLDEPTSGLDPRGRRELKHLLQSLPVTKIIATHDLELVVEICPRVIAMSGGKIFAQGATTEILNNEPLMLEHGLERPHILMHRHPHAKQLIQFDPGTFAAITSPRPNDPAQGS